jgi:hypothetical protein
MRLNHKATMYYTHDHSRAFNGYELVVYMTRALAWFSRDHKHKARRALS